MEIDFSPNVELEFGLSSTSAPDIEFGTGGVSGAIDVVKVNGTPLPIVNRSVDVPVPTKNSQLANDSHFITLADIPPFPTKTSQLTNDGSDGLNPFINATSYANASTGTGGTVRIGASWGTTISNTGYLGARTMTAAQYEDVGGGAVIGKTTLENVLTAKEYITAPTELYKTVYTYEWDGPAGTNLYDCVAILTMPAGTFTENSLVELVNQDSFNIFAKHGFVLYGSEVSTQRLWITSIGKPTGTVSLKFRIYKWGN